MRGGGRVLLTGIAITLVVVTQVDEVKAAIHCARSGGHAHAVSRAIAGNDDNLDVFIGRQLILF